jgi:tetratricopeptide (TPR) repeat protein
MEPPENAPSTQAGVVDLSAGEGRAVRLEATVDELQARLATMKDEIDALQISSAERSRPWYRQASTISTFIALLALVFSVATTMSADRREREQDQRAQQQNVRDARTLLGQLIQRLDAMPRENANLVKEFGNDPATLGQLAGNLNVENIALAGQAADIINSIRGHVTATEYLVVANALYFSGLFDRARELYQAGAALDADQVTHAALLHSYAALLVYSGGDMRVARAKMQEALDVYKKQPTSFQGQVLNTNLATHIAWTSLELFKQECAQARKHYDEALRIYNQLPEGVQKTQLRLQINALTASVNSCSPAS